MEIDREGDRNRRQRGRQKSSIERDTKITKREKKRRGGRGERLKSK